ncbi:NYN domain-containing protein [Ktedonobacter robiniae]|uniref:NYN domain-containing protein n=1 Tax=Ktedonobacter robiniae TaxID=2778365 RepID=UPI001916AFC4|nr:NYN domain-containing protein [Ktedonobacter robiniae]
MNEQATPSLQKAIVRAAFSFFTGRRSAPLAPVALLIDGENIASDFAPFMLVEAGKWGGVCIRRVYGNWSHPSMASWQAIVDHYGLTPVHHKHPVVGKNAADIMLVVDAMDLLHQGYRHFCIASSDSDYTPLIRRLREAGGIVLGIGKAETLPALKMACTIFLSTHQLLPPSANIKPLSLLPHPSREPIQPTSSPVKEAGLQTKNGDSPSKDAQLLTLLQEAYTLASRKSGDNWISVQQLGTVLQQLQPGFTPKHFGSSKLKQLVQKYPHLFQTEPRKGGQIVIRLKTT